MTNRIGLMSLFDTKLSINEDIVDEATFMPVYNSVIKHLRSRGFRVIQDPRTKKVHPNIAAQHHYARKGDLESSLEITGRCISVGFYQNVVVENNNDGKYDFDKYEKMPYLIKKRFILEAAKLLDFLVSSYGYGFGKNLQQGDTAITRIITGLNGINPSLQPLERFNGMWGADRFKRDESGWPAVEEFDNHGWNKDADGVPLRNGMIRYHRDSKGYLWQGVIYTNMNSMWQLIYGKDRRDSTWVSCGELFSMQYGDNYRKQVDPDTRAKRLGEVLEGDAAAQNFERAIQVRNVLNAL